MKKTKLFENMFLVLCMLMFGLSMNADVYYIKDDIYCDSEHGFYFKVNGGYATIVKTPSGCVKYYNEVVQIPPSVKIADNGIDSITVEVTAIGDSAFCLRSIKSIRLPLTVTKIGKYAFYRTRLESISIPSVTEIGDHAFEGCSQLESANTPSAITIGDRAFSGCSKLESVNINSVEIIGHGAFSGSGITTIEIPSSTLSISDGTFSSCPNLTSVHIAAYEIGEQAFCYCPALKSVTVASNVIQIDRRPFYECPNIESIIVDKDNPYYDSRDNCNAIIETETNTLIEGCLSTVIPNSVIGIGMFAFKEYKNLESIEIPNSVTSIDGYAFENTGLTKIEIPTSVINVSYRAFGDCTNLKSVVLPNSTYRNKWGVILPIFGQDIFSGVGSIKAPCELIVGSSFDMSELGKPFQLQGKSCYHWQGGYFYVNKITGLDDATESHQTNSITGIYDLNGRRIDALQKGFNIVRYQDGTSKKVILK